jgi:hypothetical protein
LPVLWLILYVWQYSLTSFTSIILSSLIDCVANSRNHQLNPEICSSCSDVILDQSGFSGNQVVNDYPSSSILLTHLLIRASPFGNKKPFIIEHRIIQLLLQSDAFAFFFFYLSTGTHIRYFADQLIFCWVIIRQSLSYSIILRVLFSDT